MAFDETLFYKELSNDLIEYIAYHEGDEFVINFLLKIGYTPLELIDYISFNQQEVDSIINELVEKEVRINFGLEEKK